MSNETKKIEETNGAKPGVIRWLDFSDIQPNNKQKVLLLAINGNVWQGDYLAEFKDSYMKLKLKWFPMPAIV